MFSVLGICNFASPLTLRRKANLGTETKKKEIIFIFGYTWIDIFFRWVDNKKIIDYSDHYIKKCDKSELKARNLKIIFLVNCQ